MVPAKHLLVSTNICFRQVQTYRSRMRQPIEQQLDYPLVLPWQTQPPWFRRLEILYPLTILAMLISGMLHLFRLDKKSQMIILTIENMFQKKAFVFWAKSCMP